MCGGGAKLLGCVWFATGLVAHDGEEAVAYEIFEPKMGSVGVE